MAYRFTDTDKWSDNWFLDLRALAKLLFLYLCDQCDIAGFYEVNIKKIAFDLSINQQETKKSLEEIDAKIIYSHDRRFIFIKNFIKHQKNDNLNPENNAHKGILKKLEECVDLFEFQSFNNFVFSPSLAPSEPLGRGLGKGNGKKGENKGGMGEKGEGIKDPKTWRESFEVYAQELDEAYQRLLEDKAFLRERERFFPHLNIPLSVEKAYADYWSKEIGWKNKKQSKTVNIDWKGTFRKALDFKPNQIWKSKENQNEQAQRYTIPS